MSHRNFENTGKHFFKERGVKKKRKRSKGDINDTWTVCERSHSFWNWYLLVMKKKSYSERYTFTGYCIIKPSQKWASDRQNRSYFLFLKCNLSDPANGTHRYWKKQKFFKKRLFLIPLKVLERPPRRPLFHSSSTLRKNICHLHLEWIVTHFLNSLTRNLDF